jgi:hypothetical protein
MNLVVWIMMGIAVWHFAVFVPDRFWGGIVGAFGAAAAGAVLFGLAVSGGNITDTSLAIALQAVPGALIGLGACWLYGARREEAHP